MGNQAKNFAAVASQLQSSALINKYDFLSVQSGNVKITAADAALNTGASTNGSSNTTSIRAGNVSYFSTPNQSTGGTVSVKQGAQGGTQYFATDNSNSTTTVTTGSKGGAGTIGIKQTATNSNQSLANQLKNFSTTDWLILGGVVAAGFAAYVLLK